MNINPSSLNFEVTTFQMHEFNNIPIKKEKEKKELHNLWNENQKRKGNKF